MMVRISPDLGHIVKRLRYRLLSCNVHMNFEEDSPFINIQQIRIALPHVPEIVFCNSKMTKMHDSLPMSLFTLHNFFILFDMKMFIAAAYFFPIVLTIIASDFKDIGYELRHFCFETALWFLVYYKKLYDQRDHVELPQRKYKENIDVTAYSNNLLIEYCNSIFTKINLMNKYENITINRDSTAPLEHTFGRARVRAKDIHTMNKFINVVGFINNDSYKKKIDDIEKLKGRTSSFGVTVEDRSENGMIFSSTPQQISIEFLNLINIDLDEKNEEHSNLYSFIEFLRDFDEPTITKKLTINKLTLGTAQTKTISQRIAFNVIENSNPFIAFIKTELPEQKINKAFIIKYYKILKENIETFPQINEQKATKKVLIDILNENFLTYQEFYFDALNYL